MKRFILSLLRLYHTINVALPAGVLGVSVGGCRSWPTCSEFTYEAVSRQGVLKGLAQGALRVASCHPFWSARRQTT